LPSLLPTCTTRVYACKASVKLNRVCNPKTVHQEATPRRMLQNGDRYYSGKKSNDKYFLRTLRNVKSKCIGVYCRIRSEDDSWVDAHST